MDPAEVEGEGEEAAAVPVGALLHLLGPLDPLDRPARLVQEGARGVGPPAAVVHGARGKPFILAYTWPLSDSFFSLGSSAKPSYGGGKYYGGGSTRAFSSGTKSPRGIVPLTVGVGAAAFIFPGIWLYGAYNYPYGHGYSYRNRTRRANNTDDRIQRRQDQNVTLPVTCLCAMYSACGCDDNDDNTYLDSVIGDGTNLNASLVHIGPNENGTQTIALNGTLPNTTDSESDSSDTSSGSGQAPTSSSAATQRILESSGIWAIGGIVGATVWLL